ncbi:hypothetical protein ACLESD_11860 [Pyxidicoccus sp. 3LFB2]
MAVSLAPGAQAASPIPAFPKEGTVTVQEVPDSFDRLRAFLRDYRSPAGAKYHVAVVAFTDPLNREGPAFGDESGAYLDSVVEAWRQRVDTENAVIIVLGMRNREVRVHPFSRWVRLGWEGYAVVKTVNAARFDSFAKAGDYDTGMKELVLAIDAELASRLKAVENRSAHRLKAEADAVQRGKALIAQANSGILAFENRVKQPRYVPPGAREAHARAVTGVTSAQSALGEADASRAIGLAERAVSDTAQAARLLTEYEALRTATWTRRQALQARAATLEQELVEALFDVSQERALLKRATLALQEAETLLADHALSEAASRLTNAESSLQRVEAELGSARQAYKFMTRTLPRFLAGVGALALLAGLALQFQRSARSKREAQALVQQWQTQLGQVASNLLKLEDEHKLFLGRADLVKRFEGKTALPVRQAAREVDSLFLSYDAAQRALAAAQKELAHRGPLSWLRVRPYQRALSRLTADEVVLGTEDVASHKLYLPDHHEVRMTARALVAEMQSSWERALRLVEALETPSRATWETLDRLKGELGTLEGLEGRLVELDVPPALRDERAELERQLVALQEKSRRDPLGAAEETQAVARRLSTLRARAGGLVEAASLLHGEVRQRREEAGATLARLGSEGLTLSEPGFKPDALLGQIDKLSKQALRAVKAGQDEKAVAKSREAAARASALLELCGRASRAQEEFEGRSSEIEDRVRSLRESLPEWKERLRHLRQAYAGLELRSALNKAEKATGILAHVAKCLSKARACMAPNVRHVLAGAELLDQAVEQLDEVDALFQEIETRAAAYAQARQEVETTLGAVAPPQAEASGGQLSDGVSPKPKARRLIAVLTRWRDTYASTLGKNPEEHQSALALLRTVSQQFDEVVLQSRRPEPSWARIVVDLQRIAKGFEIVSKEVKDGIPVMPAARLALTEADDTLSEVDTV